MRSRRRGPSAVATAALGVLVPGALWAACDGGAPRYTLQQVMLQVDAIKKRFEVELLASGDTEKAAVTAEELARWMRDPAYDRYLTTRTSPGDAARFTALRTAADEALDRVRSEVVGGDLPAARVAYRSLVEACDACHAVYRPGLK